MRYNNFEIDELLKSMVIIADTREQDTELFRKRFAGLGCPVERLKLNYGDYTAATDNGKISLGGVAVIERKMSIDELCNCFCKDRVRFEKELVRANNDNAQIHLLVENATWENIYNGKYKSKLNPKALTASILAWQARYDMQIHFCKPETTGLHIYKILYYQMKKLLESL